MRSFTIPPDLHSARLDQAVAQLCEISKRKAKQLLDNRCVFVEGKRIWIAGFTVRAGQKLEVALAAAAATAEPSAQTAAAPKVLYADPDVLILDKPAGVLSNGEGSLESRARELLEIPKLLAVHRLDRDTSGCLLFARDQSRKERLEKLFRDKQILKLYHVLTEESVPDSLRKIDRPLEGQPAVTHIRKLSSVPQASLLEVRLETGRMHQIRKHLAQAGHPVIGDKEYSRGVVTSSFLRSAARQMLHAYTLEFQSPFTPTLITVSAPHPADFAETISELGLTVPAAVVRRLPQ